MKREYVIPDLLASLTADALFSDAPRYKNARHTGSNEPSPLHRLGQWLKRARQAAAEAPPAAATRNTLTDDWAGGWYARTRLLQAATLAQHAADASAAEPATAQVSTSATQAARRAS